MAHRPEIPSAKPDGKSPYEAGEARDPEHAPQPACQPKIAEREHDEPTEPVEPGQQVINRFGDMGPVYAHGTDRTAPRGPGQPDTSAAIAAGEQFEEPADQRRLPAHPHVVAPAGVGAGRFLNEVLRQQALKTPGRGRIRLHGVVHAHTVLARQTSRRAPAHTPRQGRRYVEMVPGFRLFGYLRAVRANNRITENPAPMLTPSLRR